METLEASSIAELSAWEFDNTDDDDDTDIIPKGGYGNLLLKIAEGLNIELNKTVIHIQRHNEGVTIRCADESTYFAKMVIVSLPLGILKAERVKFEPQLPSEHLRAI